MQLGRMPTQVPIEQKIVTKTIPLLMKKRKRVNTRRKSMSRLMR